MAIQTLNTIKNWFKTSLKPSQQQFWDTWDSFRHKLDKVPVKDVDGIEELIEKSIPKTSISGDLNRLTKIGYDSEEKLNLIQSNITDTGDKIIINSNTEINSKIDGKSGLKLKNLKNQFKSISEIVYNQDVIPSAGIDGTAYFPYGNTVKKVNLDKTVIDYFSFSEGDYIQSKIIVSPKNGDLFLIYFDGVSYILIKFDESGILSVLKSSNSYFSYIDIDKNDNIYVEERSSRKIFKINTYTISETVYYAGNLSLGFLGFDEELNGYFFDFESRNVIYKINESGIITNFALLNLEVGNGCVKPDGSLYITPYDYDDINIYSVDKNGTSVTFFASIGYKANEPFVSENGFLYVHNNDYENGLVYKISPLGEVIILGSAGKSPRYMTVAKSGIVYTSNSDSYNLIKITLQEDTKLLTLDNDGNVIFSDKEVTVKSDFKTVNGESIVGTGNISLIASSDLDQTLEKGNTAIGKTLTLSNFDETAEIFLHPNSLSLNNEGNSTHLISQGSYLRSDYQSSGGGVNHLYLKRNIPGINFFNLPENPDGTSITIPVSINGQFADVKGNIEISGGSENSQDLQSILENGNSAKDQIIQLKTWDNPEEENSGQTANFGVDGLEFKQFQSPSYGPYAKSIKIYPYGLIYTQSPDASSIVQLSQNSLQPNDTSFNVELPSKDGILATLDDIGGIPASATESGFVNNTELQELGGTDKTINGIRIGKGNANYENNLVIGRNGLASITTGKYNVAIGNGDGDVEGPLQYLTTGNNNTMVGSDAGVNIITGTSNTGIGAAALFSNTTANSNTAVGAFALSKNLTSPFNVAIGSNALSKMVSGLGQSTAIGSYCMYDATGTDKNAAIGTYALRYNSSGYSNTAIGHTALGLNTEGHSNNAVGNYSLGAVTTGFGNTGIGKFAGKYITTGNFNIYIGSEGLPEDAASDSIINIGNRFIARGPQVSLLGTLNIQTVSIYEDNIAALAAGLAHGDIYRTSTGALMITYQNS